MTLVRWEVLCNILKVMLIPLRHLKARLLLEQGEEEVLPGVEGAVLRQEDGSFPRSLPYTPLYYSLFLSEGFSKRFCSREDFLHPYTTTRAVSTPFHVCRLAYIFYSLYWDCACRVFSLYRVSLKEEEVIHPDTLNSGIYLFDSTSLSLKSLWLNEKGRSIAAIRGS